MAGFNIIATLQLQGPTNVGPVVNAIQNSLKGITANVNITFNPGLNANLTAINQRLATLNNQLQAIAVNATNAAAAVQRLTGAFSGIQQANVRLNTSITQTAPAVQQTSRAIAESVNNMENFGRAAGLAGRRYSAFLLAGGSIVGFVTGIRNAVREAATFEQQMIRLQQVGVGTRSELNSVQTQISNLATNLGVSSRELAQASVLFAAAGVKAKDMAGALEALAKASLSPSFGNMIETVNGMIAISSQFRISMSSMESALGGINAVANEFSVESKDIIEAVTRAGGAFRTAGGTLNEFVATFTSVRSTTRESADAIATGLRTIFSSLQRGKTVEALKDLGVNLRYTRQEAEALGDVGLTEQFVGPYQAVQRLSEALAGLRSTDPRFANIATELGGLRQLSRVLPLLQETARAQEAYNIAQSGQISLEINAQQAQQGTIVRLTKLREEFLALFRTLTNTPAWQGFVTGMFTLASGIIRVTEALTPLMPLLQAFLTIKIGQNIGYLAQGVLGGAAGRGPSNTPPVGPRGYARGGVVPGTGDLDTVPAYLTPGEFVVRKQAAQSIGYNNLHSLNVQKFATGGQAKQASVASGRSFVVGEGTSVGLVARSGQNSIWKGSIDYLDITRRGKAPDPIQDFINDLKNQGVNDKDIPNYIRVRGTVNRSTLVPQRAVEFEQNVVPVITDKINDIFKALPPLKGQVLPTLSHQALSTVVGPVFEGYISRLTGKTGSGPNDNFDFPSMTAGQKQQFSKLFDPPVTSDYIDAKSTSTLSATKDIIKKGLNERIHTTGSFVKKALGGLIQPFANGGSARGTDVVPAVLTPGEFIMSRDAVSRVGLSNLEYMNSTGKARGFASGGLVQHFATGGQAAPNTIGFEQFIQQAQIGGPQALETARRRLLDSIIQQHQTADRTLSYDQARQKASEELKNIEDRMLDVNRRIQRALELEVQAAESRARADRARELSAKAAQQGNLTRAARLEAISLNYESREAAQRATIRELRDPSAQILLDRNRQPAGLAGETQQRIENGNITQGTLFQRSRRFLYERAARIGTTGALLALPYAAQAAEQFGGGDAASAIQGGPAGEAAFRRGRIVSGGLQGAATGAAIGSIFGPWGLAIGAAVGGIKGLADASSEAGKQIRDAKIAESMAALITQLQQIASGATEPTIDVVAGARRNLLRTNTEILERTAESNEPWYNRSPFSGRPLQGSPFGVLGNQGTAFYQASQRSVREEFGPQLPGIVGSLNRFAAQTGTANPTLGGGDAAQQRETLDSLTRSFAEGGGGLNRELLLIVANLRRIPVHEVEREFRAVIEQAARGERVRIAERRSTQATGNIATYFEAFVRSIEQATQSLARLENQTRALSDDFSGTVSAIRLPTHRNVELGGPDTPRFLQTVNSITSPFGSGAGLLGGGELRSSALAANSIRQLLPQAITTGLSRGPLDEHSLSDQVRTILQEGTAGQGNQQELQRYISIAVDNLRKESLEQISSQSAGDIGKLADKIFGQIGNPIQEALNKIAKEIDTVGSQFVEGLSEYGQRLARAGAQQDTVADTRVQRDRLQARLFAESRGEFGQGAELRYFSLQQAQAGLQSRQERLTGFAGERANDPEAINEAINITRQRLSTAVTTRDRLASNLSPDNRQAFQNAALAVTTLQGRANNLSQALQNLANVTERNATVQERLSVLDRDRESRLGFAERLLTAGPDEVNRLTRGGILAQGGIEQGTLAHLPQQQRQEAVEFLRSAGDAIIPGLGNGRLTAREHLNQLALGTFPELGQAPEQRQERTALEGQLLANSDTAVRAGELIAGQTRSAADTFFQRLTTVHNTLFTELRNNQIIMSQFLIGSQRATAVVERRDLAPQERNAAVLSGFGINRQSQVEQIRANLPNIQRVIADVNRERSFIQQARNYTTGQAGADLENIIGQGDTGFTVGDGRVNFTNDRTATALRGRLQSVTGVNPDQAERLFTNLTRNATRNISQAGSLTGANRRAFTEAFSTTVEQHFLEQAARVRAGVSEENLRGVSNLFGRGQALEGRTPNQFRDFISSLSPEQQNVFSEQGLSRFTQTQPLEGLNARITQADATVQRLTESFEQLNAQVSQINQARTGAGYATGGSVFRPRGSDTVPAMLTPGEFVVNARAAQEHLPLLRAINGNNRTVHAAGGGLVNYLAEGGELAGGSGLLASIFWRLWRNRVAEQQARTPSVTVTDPWNTLPEQSATIRPPEPLPVRRNQIRANSLRPRQLPSQLQTTIDFVPPRFGNELPPVGTGVNPNYETIDQAAERILRGRNVGVGNRTLGATTTNPWEFPEPAVIGNGGRTLPDLPGGTEGITPDYVPRPGGIRPNAPSLGSRALNYLGQSFEIGGSRTTATIAGRTIPGALGRNVISSGNTLLGRTAGSVGRSIFNPITLAIEGLNISNQASSVSGTQEQASRPHISEGLRAQAEQTSGLGHFGLQAWATAADFSPVESVASATNFLFRMRNTIPGFGGTGSGMSPWEERALEMENLRRQERVRESAAARNQQVGAEIAAGIRPWVEARAAQIEATGYNSAPPPDWREWMPTFYRSFGESAQAFGGPNQYDVDRARGSAYYNAGSRRLSDAVEAAGMLDFLYSGENDDLIRWLDTVEITGGSTRPTIGGVEQDYVASGNPEARALRFFRSRANNPRAFVRGSGYPQGLNQGTLIRTLRNLRQSLGEAEQRQEQWFVRYYPNLFQNIEYPSSIMEGTFNTLNRVGGANSPNVAALALEAERTRAFEPADDIPARQRDAINQIRTRQGEILLQRLRQANPDDWWNGSASKAAALASGGPGWSDILRQYYNTNGLPDDIPEGSSDLLYMAAGGIVAGDTAGRAAFGSTREGRRLSARRDELREAIQNFGYRPEFIRELREINDRFSSAGFAGSYNAGLGSQIATQGRLSNINQILAAGNLLPGQELQYSLAGQIAQMEQSANVNDMREFLEAAQGMSYLTQLRRRPQGFANGGFVDSVPAMLTPGEFVLNRRAVAAVGAAQLDRVNRFADGGLVPAGATSGGLNIPGDFANSIARFEATASAFGGNVSRFVTDGVEAMNRSLSTMQGVAGQLSQAFDRIPRTIELSMPAPMNVVVTLNGADVLANMTGPMRDMMLRVAREEVVRAFDQRIPDAGRPTFNGTEGGNKPSINYI